MKYVPPYGRESEGDAANYINGDPSVGRQGSIPPANAFEHPMREIVHVIEKNQIIPDSNDLYQLIKATRSQRANYVQDTGSANHLSVALDPPLAAYTLGLVLRVRIKTTNTGATLINAGAGEVPVRKMSGADVANGDLPAGGIATLVFDGTAFQLSNFGGAGGGTGGAVYEVKIPYCVDTSTTPGIVTANFSPAITTLVAGDEIAVKIGNTAPGPTIININAMPSINLKPNGGGEMLQGDMHAGNIVIFFYDGTNLYFQPDPQIDAPVQYMVGPGQHFPDVTTAMNTIKRKTIGANGFVTLKMVAGLYTGNIVLNHPSGDRIAIRGTMLGANPTWADFSVTGSDTAHRASDSNFNLAMLRSRYGTEIQVGTAAGSYGIQNQGAGRPQIVDILFTGTQQPPGAVTSNPNQMAIWLSSGILYCNNVSVWGCQFGAYISQQLLTDSLFICACSSHGVHNQGGSLWLNYGGVFGNTVNGVNNVFGEGRYYQSRVQGNGATGISAFDGSAIDAAYSVALTNHDWDAYSYAGSAIYFSGSSFGPISPAANTVGNIGAIIGSS